MKKLIIVAIILVFLNSCGNTRPYYQEFKVNSISGKENSDGIYFDDSNCQVKYNFWSDGGNAGFEIFNKTDGDLILDLTKTFFVKNGYAYPYFQRRTFSNSSSTTHESTIGVSNYRLRTEYSSKIKSEVSKMNGTEYIEREFVTIPSKTKVSIVEFSLETVRYKNCDYFKYPSSSEVKPLLFKESGSPIIFKNIIVYNSGSSQNKIEHNFYVSEIVNYPEKAFMKNETKDRCGETLDTPKKVFKNIDVKRFYLKYF